MSYESVIEHMRRELVAGATRRRGRERMQRGMGAAVVAVAVVIATLALVRNNDHTTRLSTQPVVGPTAAQSEACYSFLDLSSALAPGPSATAAIEQFAALAQASGDKTLAKTAATIRDNYPRETTAAPDEELGKKLGSAYKDVIDRCRAIGVPGFNPVYVPASTGPPPRVDLRTYGTEQSLAVGDRLPEGATAPQGRDLSPVAVAASAEGAFVMTWSYQRGAASGRTFCRNYGVRGSTRTSTSGTCGPENDTKSAPASGIRVNGAGSNFGDDATTILVPDSTSFVVIDRADERLVQRPVAGIAVFVWPLNGSPAQADWVVRAYDPDGVVLGCVASGSRSC